MILRPKTVSRSNNVLKNTNNFHLLLSSLVCAWIIYVKTGKTLESWEVTLMSLDRSWLPLSENLDHHPPKKTNRSARSIWRYRFSAGVWNCQILNQVVESQLFTYLWNRYHQWLSDIELIQLRGFFFQLLIQELTPVSLLERESGFEIVTQLADTGKRPTSHLLVYGVWQHTLRLEKGKMIRIYLERHADPANSERAKNETTKHQTERGAATKDGESWESHGPGNFSQVLKLRWGRDSMQLVIVTMRRDA
jgi:hypothetical protein